MTRSNAPTIPTEQVIPTGVVLDSIGSMREVNDSLGGMQRRDLVFYRATPLLHKTLT